MKRPMVWFGLAMLLGEILGLWASGWLIACAIIGLLLFCVVSGIRYRHMFSCICLCLVPVFCLVGILRVNYCRQIEEQVTDHPELWPEVIEGRVITTEDKDTYRVYELRTGSFPGYDLRVRCLTAKDERGRAVLPGDHIVLEGQPELIPEATNPGCFDARSYYRQKNIYLQYRKARVLSVTQRGQRWFRGLFILRSCMVLVIHESLEPETAGVLSAIVAGERHEVPEDISALYQTQGIGHILAISALHLSIVGAGLYQILRRMCFPGPLRHMLAIGTVLLYGCLCGFSISSIRAIIMFIFLMGSYMIGRRRDEWTALSAAGIGLMLYQPYCICNYAFLLSFGCISSLLMMSRLRGKVPGLYITMFTLPVTAWFQYEVSVYTVLLNMFVVPAMGILYPLGLIGSMIGCVWYFPGKMLIVSAGVILKVFEALCRVAAQLPFAHMVTGRPAIWKLVMIYSALLLYIGICLKKRHRWMIYKKFWWLIYLLLFLHESPQTTEILFLDVGQGDCQLIRTSDGMTFMIDGGSTTDLQIGEHVLAKVLKYYGITSLDGLILTHMDEDHINGTTWLLEHHYDIRTIYLSGAISNKSMETAYVSQAQALKIPVYKLYSGSAITCKDLRMQCLHPAADFRTDEDNAGSLVLLLRCQEYNFLFTGDVEGQGENALTEALWSLWTKGDWGDRIHVLKVAHHGSKYSSSEAFLMAARPQQAIISVGARNRYGHPHAETLSRLREAGCQLYTTAEVGAIRYTCRKDRLEIAIYR